MGILGVMRDRLLGRPKTRDYRQVTSHPFRRHRDLPPFTFEMIREMLKDPTVCLGLAMRAAPLLQSEIAYKNGEEWIPGVRSERDDVSVFLTRQVKRFWKHELHKVLRAQIWGWSAGEVTYRLHNGLVEIDRTLHRRSEDVFALTEDGEVRGVKFTRVGKHGVVRLRTPQCYWYAYNPDAEGAYGLSALYGCYSPWADKCLNGGAVDVRRLFMHKDAYGGMAISYPAETSYIQGDEKPNRDLAREMVEQYKAGGVVTFPSEVDRETGQKLWEIQYAQVPSNPVHILQYPKDLDVEILRGLEIPDDILTSESTGAWAGKQVPMQAFYVNCDRWLGSVIQALTEQVFEPLVLLNWGQAIDFQIETKPLAQQAREMAEDAPEPPVTPVQSAPGLMRRFGLAEALVGSGAVQAGSMLSAGRRIIEERQGRKRLSRSPAGGVTIRGKKFKGGQFIPREVMDRATPEEQSQVV